ncbi:type II secretory pathway protein J [Oleiphilus messinensis]|uniref:Type II secretion system protein J n=2 Tax=Oleiphilus messinensis TaxID=141451 RepID=A0A1Y0I9G6_9GAMM|nr:type II secretory pathway protein J [Oleiphilus messinensis]
MVPGKESQVNGFTLIEVLIAITITALIGLGVWSVLNMTINTQKTLMKRTEQIKSLQRAFLVLQRDMVQLTSRPVRTEYGDMDYALSTRNTFYKLELTRQGWRNPLNQFRSELQRVAYEFADNRLTRWYWPVLDRAQDSQPREQVLLEDVDDIKIQFLVQNNRWVSEWPTDGNVGGDDSTYRFYTLPKAIMITMTSPLFGEVYQTYPLVQFRRGTVQEKDGGDGTGDGDSKGAGVDGDQVEK